MSATAMSAALPRGRTRVTPGHAVKDAVVTAPLAVRLYRRAVS